MTRPLVLVNGRVEEGRPDPDDLLDFTRLAATMAHRLRVCCIQPELADAFQRFADGRAS